MAERRENWRGRPYFLMAAIGSAVGLGNVWRFPYIAYANGGGAFLIPYFVALLTAGIPLMMLEYALGVKMQGAPHVAFSKIKRGLEWVGWWSILAAFVIITYYAVVMAWCWNYLYHSFTLAWGKDAGGFFVTKVLQRTGGPAELGGIPMGILLGLLITWVVIYLIIYKGIGRVAKVVMATVPLPIILIAILVVRGITLPGAVDGLNFYLAPDFSKLLEPKVWLAAYGQIFFSLSLAMGIMIVYASYLPNDSDVTNNAFITSFANCGTSFFAGFAIFSTLGYLAHVTGVDISKVAVAGPGLAFVTIPTAISKLPFAAAFFGAVFFLMLLTLAVDSLFSLVEADVTAMIDKWGVRRERVAFVICLVAFLIGLLYTSRGGIYWLDIVDHWINNYGLPAIGLAEVIVIGFVFGTKPFRRFLNSVSEIRVGVWWDYMIKIVTPIILGATLITSFCGEVKKAYEGYPMWALIIGGWAIVVGIVILSFVLMRARGKEGGSR
ncbi:MAG: sodium-dependent transporter [Deltaproteobacteria bacterium]|nr:sodium-dependent transporter [Deltaproteobacteria bacterium]